MSDQVPPPKEEHDDESNSETYSLLMNSSIPVAIGVLATVIASYYGLVEIPNWSIEKLDQVELASGEMYPPELTESEQRGREVYRSMGCIYCHSQQVRQGDFGKDMSRGWGRRASVPLDYAGEDTPYLGTMRTGPDLRNIGARQPSKQWHYLHLYNPQITSKGSNMPPFRFLFEKVEIEGQTGPPMHWIDLPEEYREEGYYVVASQDAQDLVDYLLSLNYQADVPRDAMRPAASDENTEGGGS
jgi:cytochrome c oxidase cbb3-type subunit 2